ncbi:SDR family oxidoreductase [Fibrella sp. ES10-3-2-2]|nr:D-mannonate oxidoreductase [Fibrella sp. ES10-3-2-2]
MTTEVTHTAPVNPFDLTGTVTIVTGATGVLGEAFCSAIAQAGGTVVLIARNEQMGLERQEALCKTGANALFVRADVLVQAELDAACDTVLATYGRIDNLVNGAGGNVPEAVIGPDKDIFSVEMEAIKKVFDLNLYGTMMPTFTFGKHIAEKGGSIINISSMASQTTITRVLGYSMAKAAVDNFTRWMAVELANRYGDRVRINAIAPGFFISHQNRALLTQPDGSYTSRGEAVIRSTPFRRFGEPDELSGTLIWLLSGASRFVSGEVVCVDGAFHVFSGV